MSDNAPHFFNSWVEEFDSCNMRKLICHWQVYQDWKRELTKKFKDEEITLSVYHKQYLLLEQTDEYKFNILLSQTAKMLEKNPKMEDFVIYLKNK